MTVSIEHSNTYIAPTELPEPVTEIRWYRTDTGSGLTTIRRASVGGSVESVTLRLKLFGRIRSLRLRFP